MFAGLQRQPTQRRQTTRVIPALKAALLATVVMLGSLCADSAQAGCLDWLFGRQPAYSAGYGSYSAGYGSYTRAHAGSPYAAGYGSYYGAYGVAPQFTGSQSSGIANTGIVAAQRPALPIAASGDLTTVQSFNNPSVYTGLPAGMAQAPVAFANPNQTAYRLPLAGSTAPLGTQSYSTPTAYSAPAGAFNQPSYAANRVPIAETLRGTTGINPLIGTTPYTAGYGTTAPLTYNAPVSYNQPVATTAYPLTLAPTQTAARPVFGSGLSRFFNSLLGRRNTNYASSYYRAPITYYRPLTSVNPVTGTTVTVQQPCSSYVQQLQRAPYNSFMPLGNGAVPIGPPTPVTMNGDVCATTAPMTTLPNSYGPNSYGPSNWTPSAATPGTFIPPTNSIGQVGAELSPGDFGASTIPSTIPNAGSQYNSPNTSPLTGAGGSPDHDPVGKPHLDDMDVNRPNYTEPPLSYREPRESEPRESARREAVRPNYDYNYDYGNNGTSDEDPYPYGELKSQPRETAPRDSGTSVGPPISLDPPVNEQASRGKVSPWINDLNGNDLNRATKPNATKPDQSLTSQTPPSLQGFNVPSTDRLKAPELSNSEWANSEWANRDFSTLRPIGAGEKSVPPFTSAHANTQTYDSSAVAQPPDAPATLPPRQPRRTPQLPSPSFRPVDPSLLFRNNENSASARTISRDRVTVPVVEATARHQNVRPVAAWEPIVPTRKPAPRRKRDTSGWLPND